LIVPILTTFKVEALNNTSTSVEILETSGGRLKNIYVAIILCLNTFIASENVPLFGLGKSQLI
jgi:hypothetical protein